MLDIFSDINPSSRELLEVIKKIHTERSSISDDLNFTRKDIEQIIGWERYKVARAIAPLENSGHLSVDKKSKPYTYRLLADNDNGLKMDGILDPKQLAEKINANPDKIDPIYRSAFGVQ